MIDIIASLSSLHTHTLTPVARQLYVHVVVSTVNFTRKFFSVFSFHCNTYTVYSNCMLPIFPTSVVRVSSVLLLDPFGGR